MFVGRLDKEFDDYYMDWDWCNVMAARDFIASYSGDKPLCVILTLGYPHPPYAVEEPFYHNQATMCRTRHWKYIRRQFEEDELYDLIHDPMELNNRIQDPSCSEIISDLRLKMLDWFQTTADTLPRSEDSR